ncbi:MAG: protein phosphatase 2C domain-containing protein [Candidatus Hodarchaeales archaeon]
MNTDCAFNIGTTHDVCQDYALSGEYSVTIADGCSGSVLSDFGSRVLSVTAMNKMLELKSLHDLEEKELILLSRPSVKVLNLPPECLDATLLCAAKIDDTPEAICYGDGVIAVKLKNNVTLVISVEYTDSYPFYINYLFDKTGRFKNWTADHNKRKVVFSAIKENGEVEVINNDCDSTTRLRYNEYEVGIIRVSDYRTMIETISPDVESIIILSDGVQSFYQTIITGTSKHNEKVTYHEVLKELLSFKNYTGRFVQRRMNKFIKTCKRNDWNHSDDISIAAIYLGE